MYRFAVQVPLVDSGRTAVRVGSRLALALALAAGGLVSVAVMEPVLLRAYYFPGLAAVTVCAVLAGGRYGLVTVVGFAAGFAWLFVEPRWAFSVRSPADLTALVAFLAVGVFVATLGGALRRAFSQLRDQHALLDLSYRQREDLLHALAHDVRTPLNVIAMNASLLARAAGDEAAIRRRTSAIQNSVASIDAMLQDLVEVAALESGQVALKRAPVDLAALVTATKESLAGALPVDRLDVALPGDLPRLHADAKRVERVLVNLVTNALKYSSGRVAVRALPQDQQVVLSVCDDGPGLAAEDLQRVFEKYYRAGEAREQQGLGLGLYITRLLVEAHGGRIWAESAPGKGCTFHVAMPAAPAEESLAAAT